MENNKDTRSLKGWYTIAERNIFFRSTWEVYYAQYLEALKKSGEIIAWDYEPDTFWFEKIRRGVTNYKPDFRVMTKKHGIEYHEVKGWMDPKSKVKLERMKRYHPNVKVVLIEKDVIQAIKKQAGILPKAVPVKVEKKEPKKPKGVKMIHCSDGVMRPINEVLAKYV